MSARFPTALLGAILGSSLLTAPASAAAPAHVALVIGNATYTTMPQLPGCLPSAHAVAAALTGAGFDVVEREDTTSGAMDAAVGEFVAKLAKAPNAATVIYVCSYGTMYNNRPFLLPVSATITRPADVLTQGVLAKSLIDALRRGNAGPTMVAVDVVAAPIPGAPLAVALDSATQNLPDQTALIVAGDIRQANAPSPLAAALAEQLKSPDVQTETLLPALQQALAMRAITAAAMHQANTSGYLVGTAPAGTPAPTTTLAGVAPPPLTNPAVTLPGEGQMADGDRRFVQGALQKLGYYSGQVDGVFGPDTRAAIRRYQHEIGAPMTGQLTPDQATRLARGG
jgi:hypothetical protein